MKKRNIFITLNDVVRDIDTPLKKIIQEYNEKTFVGEHILADESVEKIDNKIYDMSDVPLKDINVKSDGLIKPYEAELESTNNILFDIPEQERIAWDYNVKHHVSLKDLEDIMFFSYAFEIFGRSNEKYKNAMNDLNQLIFKLNHYNNNDNIATTVNILSLERDISKSSTLFFLSKYKFAGSNIKFVYDYSKIWEIADCIITANPFLLKNKKRGKKIMKINTEYNQDVKVKNNFDSLTDILENEENLKIF